MKQKGFTLIELLIVIAILGVIVAVVALSVSNFFGAAGNETATDNRTIFEQLSSEPITGLNLTDLNFMVDYCVLHYGNALPERTYWAVLATVYQNQILILYEMEGNKP